MPGGQVRVRNKLVRTPRAVSFLLYKGESMAKRKPKVKQPKVGERLEMWLHELNIRPVGVSQERAMFEVQKIIEELK